MNRSETPNSDSLPESGVGSEALGKTAPTKRKAAAGGRPVPRTAHERRLRRERIASYAVGVLLVTAGLSLGAWILWPYVAPIAGPRLVFDEMAYDFGAIDQTRQVRYVFTFVNRGTEILHVKDVVPS